MGQFLQDQALVYRKAHSRRTWLRRLIRIMSIVVVFCTTYALILPAITMEKKPLCGLEEHDHNHECYIAGYPFQCPQMYTAEAVIHTHEGLCFDASGALICSLPEIVQHTHEDSCYETIELEPCTLPETEGHLHSDSCRELTDSPQCGLEETAAHTHAEACYQPGEKYICQKAECAPHRHEAACYGQEETLICKLDEAEAHVHTESCYKTELVPGCGQEEIPPHNHTENCYIQENQLSCTLPQVPPHIHTDNCYQSETVPICTLPEDDAHTHQDSCYETQQRLVCSLTETEGHSHDSACYSLTSKQICTLEETVGHLHSDACNISQSTLICLLHETEGHWHSQDCYQKKLVCQLPETEGHSHNDLCKEQILTCKLPEGPGHSHTDACMTRLICTLEETEPHAHTDICQGGEQKELICTLPEIQPHTHTESCADPCEIPSVEIHIHTEACLMTDEQIAASRICSLETHIHDDTCYEEVPFPPEEGYLCGFGSHSHNEQCHDETGALVCNIPEHIHNIACVLENYEPTADMESAADWESTFQYITFTSHWPTDVLAIARTQLGYSESERNCFLYDDGTIRGYTRYGAWYGQPYDDWCAMFVSFCLHYGGVENFPLDAGCNSWAEKLRQIDAYHVPDGYAPKPGDLVFFDWETDASLDHVGLVAEITADGTVITIEGNSDNTVRYCSYLPGNACLAGYGELPEGNQKPETVQQSYSGTDYTVTVTYDATAKLPEDAVLTVREILPDTEEYASYYAQAVAAVQNPDHPEAEVSIPFARFFDIRFLSNEETIEPEGPVDVSITYLDRIPIALEDESKVVHFAESGIEVLEAQTNTEENLADTFTFTQSSFSVSGTVVTTIPGMSSNLSLAKNVLTDAFLYDPLYWQYYNANSPIGTAGSFHIVAFDTANLNTHTNGNILANKLYANSNFGTNNYPNELSYIQNYLQVNGGSASSDQHVLVLGSGNNLTLVDNGNAFAIGDRKLDRPKNLVQDEDTDTAPFINLHRVKAEVRQIGANLASYADTGLNISYQQQYNRISLTDADDVGILNVVPGDASVFGKHQILLDGFSAGHSGSIVINVDCAGYSTVNLPNEALVVIDGQVQGTNEVVEFSNGKVLWNFINASGVTINANRMTGMIIAPGATVNINQNLNGTVVADVVNVRAESHRTDFTGKIVPKPPKEDDVETGRFITIQKIKAGFVGTTLAGAKFELYEQDNTQWQKVDTPSIITDQNGLFLLTGLEPDTAYRLVEIEAPTGYVLSTEPFDFWIRSASNITAPPDAPANFKGTAVDSGQILNIPNSPAEGIDTTSLKIKKEWIRDTVAIPSRISVDIYQIATKEGQSSEPVLFKTVILTQALNWEREVTDLPKSVTADDGSVTSYSYTVQEHPVPGFRATYSENNARGITEETILITNKEVGEGYELPETGGSGTANYRIYGLLLILSALLGGILPARREKRF